LGREIQLDLNDHSSTYALYSVLRAEEDTKRTQILALKCWQYNKKTWLEHRQNEKVPRGAKT
jgi:hypothetical protein